MPTNTPLATKLVVTNRQALERKYGAAGVQAIAQAVAVLAGIDATRGLDTSLVYLDNELSLGEAEVKDTKDPVQNKAAIDALATKLRPEYIMILGSHDVVPYQELKNKLFEPDGDPDRFAMSDLPYACEAPFSQFVENFLGPTRVVGRVPDLTGANEPSYLLEQLTQIGAATSLPRPDTAFAISAEVWVGSTKKSVRNILGAVPSVLASPTAGTSFTQAQLGEKVHFVNCHGNQSDHTFSGEGPSDTFQDAMDARKLNGVSAGTVAAFECCYGAELYDPRGLPAMSIANSYLKKGAVGVVASTTIAYGPPDDNANADVICQLFLEQLLNGASLGRALLEARLQYLASQSVVDPYDEKTLAQFVLLGDPSLYPFIGSNTVTADTSSEGKAVAHAARLQRRARLMKTGERLAKECAYTVEPRSKKAATDALNREGLASVRQSFQNLRVFDVRQPASGGKTVGKAWKSMPKAEQVFVATRKRAQNGSSSKSARIDAVLAYEVNGQIVECALVSR